MVPVEAEKVRLLMVNNIIKTTEMKVTFGRKIE